MKAGPFKRRGRIRDLSLGAPIVLAGYAYAFAERLRDNPGAFRGFGWHPEAILGASPAIQAHLAFALAALAIGAFQFAAAKGTHRHRFLGWAWSVIMVAMSAAALFITREFGVLQAVAIVVVAMTAWAVWQARKANIVEHASKMQALYFGALAFVGLFTLIPGRATWELFFSGR